MKGSARRCRPEEVVGSEAPAMRSNQFCLSCAGVFDALSSSVDSQNASDKNLVSFQRMLIELLPFETQKKFSDGIDTEIAWSLF